MLIAENIQIEWDEGGCYLHVDGETWRVADPEQLYDRVKAAILPWLIERDEARESYRTRHTQDVFRGSDGALVGHFSYFACDPDESGGLDEHWHSVHADIWDAREGK